MKKNSETIADQSVSPSAEPGLELEQRARRELAALLERLHVNYPRGTHKLAELLSAHGVTISSQSVSAARLAAEARAEALEKALREVLSLFPEDMSPGDRLGWHFKDRTTDIVTCARAALASGPDAGAGAEGGTE